MGVTLTNAPVVAPSGKPPRLEQGDRLSRAEFERRYSAMPEIKKAELIEGSVFMPSPVRANHHGGPHIDLATLLRIHAGRRDGLLVYDNTTVRLDELNEPQPDVVLMRRGGQARIDEDDYIAGAPEFIAEIAASSASYDLHQKKRAYLRAGVREYLVWLTEEERIILWRLEGGEYMEIEPTADGLLESVEFPGLVFDCPALLRGDFTAALGRIQGGC